jgi:hypothetical protein
VQEGEGRGVGVAEMHPDMMLTHKREKEAELLAVQGGPLVK